ncbi:MAG TPA: serine/threonine-protein kinase [Planctomycetota bacterium]|nr:serine/threonine-protein kinase [Planctomycetota bacterium]
MQYDRDAVLCQLLIRRHAVPVAGLASCAAEQRTALARGEKPPELSDLLVARGFVARTDLERLVAEAQEEQRTPRKKRRAGSSSGRHTPPGPPRKDRDGVCAGDTLGPYTVLERIAKGGMGAVFKGEDRLTGEPVALKVLAGDRARRDPDAARFLREARLACVLKHEGLVRGLGFGTDRGQRYFAMELVQGESLRQRLKSGPLSEDEARAVGAAVARALHYAHERNVVHRDVKPDNILLAPGGIVKICDLGLAREAGVDATVTASGAALGTPRYMSPEQARGERDVDARTDMYSLGVTLFHALTGSPPFPEESGIVVMSRHLFDEVPSVRSLRPSISQETANLVTRMTRRRREDRFANMAEVAEALSADALVSFR